VCCLGEGRVECREPRGRTNSDSSVVQGTALGGQNQSKGGKDLRMKGSETEVKRGNRGEIRGGKSRLGSCKRTLRRHFLMERKVRLGRELTKVKCWSFLESSSWLNLLAKERRQSESEGNDGEPEERR